MSKIVNFINSNGEKGT